MVVGGDSRDKLALERHVTDFIAGVSAAK